MTPCRPRTNPPAVCSTQSLSDCAGSWSPRSASLLAASPFHGEGHRKVWARLRFAGIRTSRRRVLRLMRDHDLLAPSRVGRPHGPKAHDGTIRTERVDGMWGTDLTSTMTGEGARGRRSGATPGGRPGSEAPGSRRSSRCAKVCASPSVPSARASLPA